MEVFFGILWALEATTGRFTEVQGTLGHSKALEGITAFYFYRLLMNHRRV